MLANKKAYRYPVLILVSAFQLYGDVLYFMTEHYENYFHVNFSSALYYIVYFSLFNLFWIIIPSASIAYGTVKIIQAFKLLEGKKNA